MPSIHKTIIAVMSLAFVAASGLTACSERKSGAQPDQLPRGTAPVAPGANPKTGVPGTPVVNTANAAPVTPKANPVPGGKPNILFIMGDDIGWMQPSIYHRGLMVGETPNIDRIGREGAMFTDYLAMQSCTSGRNAFFTGMYPLRTGMIPPQLPGSPTYLKPGTPALAKFLLDLGYTTGEFGKNHLGDHTEALPTAHGFQEYWGYLYHLDAMQQVSFPDINKTPTVQTVAPPCKNTPIPGVPEVPGAVDPKTTRCLTPPRPILSCRSPDGTAENQMCKDEGPLTLDRSRTVDEEISSKVDRLPRPQRSGEDRQAVLRLVQPGAHARHDRCCLRSTRRCWVSAAARTGASTKPA